VSYGRVRNFLGAQRGRGTGTDRKPGRYIPNLPDAEKLLNWESDRELEPRLFEVMSKIPLKWLPKEGTHNGLPVDVSDFIRQVEKAG
jgi:hypothetical protein